MCTWTLPTHSTRPNLKEMWWMVLQLPGISAGSAAVRRMNKSHRPDLIRQEPMATPHSSKCSEHTWRALDLQVFLQSFRKLQRNPKSLSIAVRRSATGNVPSHLTCLLPKSVFLILCIILTFTWRLQSQLLPMRHLASSKYDIITFWIKCVTPTCEFLLASTPPGNL